MAAPKNYFPNFDDFKSKAEKGNLIPVYKEILADTETPVSAFMKLTAVDEGDLAMLIFRTADNLRQIKSLENTHPELSEKAAKSIQLLLREPVVIPL